MPQYSEVSDLVCGSKFVQRRANTSAHDHWVAAATSRYPHFQSLQTPSYDSRQARAARQYLQAEVQAVKHAMALVKRQQNAFLPLYRLPDELLSLIFCMWAEMQPHYYPGMESLDELIKPFAKRRHHPRRGWLRSALKTCHRFREVALDTPDLWTNVTFSLGPDFAELFLERSGTLPILMDVWWPGDSDDRDEFSDDVASWVYSQVRDNLYRTHTLRIINHSEDRYGDGDFQSLVQAAPLLHTFWLYNSDSWPSAFPSPIFASSAPRLTSVLLRGLRQIEWAPAAFTHLTRLVIDDEDHTIERAEPNFELFVEDFISQLKRLPRLEHLSIRNLLPNNIREALDDVQLTVLPRLIKLELEGIATRVIFLLVSLRWRPDARVHLTINGELASNTVDVVFGFLKYTLRDEPFVVDAKTLRLHVEDSGCPTDIWLWRAELNLPLSPEVLETPDLRITMKVRTGKQFFDILDILDLSQLRTISTSSVPYHRTQWRPAFLRCKDVVRVCCEDRSTGVSLVEALYDDIGHRKGNWADGWLPYARNKVTEAPEEPLPPPEDFLFPKLGLLYLPVIDWTAPTTLMGYVEGPTPFVQFEIVVTERDKKDRPLMAVFYSFKAGVKLHTLTTLLSRHTWTASF
ncbi:hypothetical protein PENSPDRAFT_754549 [Peniophora sp. CONT]|nr:hypothetical protein PENSPDRAFT_754549 [Peniophora sp. CONT]